MSKTTITAQSNTTTTVKFDDENAPKLLQDAPIDFGGQGKFDDDLEHVDESFDMGPDVMDQVGRSEVMDKAIGGDAFVTGDMGGRDDVFGSEIGRSGAPGAGEPTRAEIMEGRSMAQDPAGGGGTGGGGGGGANSTPEEREEAAKYHESEADHYYANATNAVPGAPMSEDYVLLNIHDSYARILRDNKDPEKVAELIEAWREQNGGGEPNKTDRPAPDDAGGGGQGPVPEDVEIPLGFDINWGGDHDFGGAPGGADIFEALGDPSVNPGRDEEERQKVDPGQMTPEDVANPSVDPVDVWM